MIRFLAILCLFGIAFTQWNKPILVSKKPNNLGSLYVDNLSGKRYVFFKNVSESSSTVLSFLCLNVYNKENALTTEKCIRLKVLIDQISVSGSDDGTQLYVAFQAKRSLRGVSCDGSDVSGCWDIYYIESKDSGVTWSQPTAVPRKDMNDVNHRNKPQILFISETSRIFIVYYIAGHFQYVTKPSSSIIFKNEIYFADGDPATDYKLVYTLNKGNVGLNLLTFYYSGSQLVRIFSKDNGIKWETEVITGISHLRYMPILLSLSQKKDKIYTVKIVNGFYRLFTLYSEKGFKEREMPHIEFEGYNPMVTMVPNDESKFLITGKLKSQNITTFIWDDEWEGLTDLKTYPPINTQSTPVLRMLLGEFEIVLLHYIDENLYMSSCKIKNPE